MKKARFKRLYSTVFFIASITIGLWLILKNFNENIAFFYSPSELLYKKPIEKRLRVGGLVLEGSIIKIDSLTTEFSLTDNAAIIKVQYKGLLPNLFREKQGVVARGRLVNGVFVADELLAKHDENYMPKEIKSSLNKGKCPSCLN